MCKYALSVAGPWTRHYAFKSASTPFCKPVAHPETSAFVFLLLLFYSHASHAQLTILSSRVLWAKLHCMWSVCWKPGQPREKVMSIIEAASQGPSSNGLTTAAKAINAQLMKFRAFWRAYKNVCALLKNWLWSGCTMHIFLSEVCNPGFLRSPE